jgi:hypothetical protein
VLWLCVNSREGNFHEVFFLNNDVCPFLPLIAIFGSSWSNMVFDPLHYYILENLINWFSKKGDTVEIKDAGIVHESIQNESSILRFLVLQNKISYTIPASLVEMQTGP